MYALATSSPVSITWRERSQKREFESEKVDFVSVGGREGLAPN